MPIYQYKCKQCKIEIDKLHSFHDKSEIKCESCGAVLVKMLDSVQINYKGWDWPGKDNREKKYRDRRSEIMEKRQRNSHAEMKLAPNVDGEIVDSWGDAQKLASEKGYLSSSYDNKINGV